MACLALVLAAVGCGSSTRSSPPASAAISPTASRTAHRVRTPADSRQLLETQRHRLPGGRTYYLFAASAATPEPLFIVLHGLGNGPVRVASDSRFTDYARAHHLAVAYGVGIAEAWNAGQCCHHDKADDTAYLAALVADAERVTAIDRHRVYVLGFSNGGMMALRAACERPDLFAAAGVMAGALVTPCRPLRGIPERPIYVRQFQGRGDTTLPPAGGPNKRLGFDALPLSSEARRLPPGSTLDLTYLNLGHEWATVDNSGTDATSAFVTWMLRHHR